MNVTLVTSGSAGSLLLGTAACVAGKDPERIKNLPDLQGIKDQVIIQKTHRFGYDHAVRAPMEELLEELAPDWGEGRIFRPYRDIRFSSDKSPYKTNIAANVGEGYVQLTADGLGAGAGMWEMAPDQL